MSVLTFDELIHRLENELHRLHYTEGSITGYRRAWKHIASFLMPRDYPVLAKKQGFASLIPSTDFLSLKKGEH